MYTKKVVDLLQVMLFLVVQWGWSSDHWTLYPTPFQPYPAFEPSTMGLARGKLSEYQGCSKETANKEG